MTLGPNPTEAEVEQIVDNAIYAIYAIAESICGFLLTEPSMHLAAYVSFMNSVSERCETHNHERMGINQARQEIRLAFETLHAARMNMGQPRNGWESLAEHSLTHDPEGL